MSSAPGGPSPLREAARRYLPHRLRAEVMAAARRLVGDAVAVAQPPAHTPHGGLDRPVAGSTVTGDVLEVTGWAIHDGRMASRVEVRVDGVLLGRARLGLTRPDLPPLGPDSIGAGFDLTAPLPAPARRSTFTVTVVAHFSGGRRLVLEAPGLAATPRPLPARPLRLTDPASAPVAAARPPRGPSAGAGSRAHVLAVTHQLDLGGGQLYLQDLLRGLARRGRLQLTVATTADGPLREELEEIGVAVHLLPSWPHQGAAAYESRLDELTAWARAIGVDAVLANTVMSFPAIHLAARLAVPSVWAIHESYALPVLWHAVLGPGADSAVRAAAEASLAAADRLVFEAAATRALYTPAAPADRCLHIPYGIEMDALDEAAVGLDRGTARRHLGIDEEARVLLCMGTFEPRKAQTVLVRAFSEVADRHPQARVVLVGDTGSPYAAGVRALAAATGLGPRVRLEPVGPGILPWYAAADILVSASDVESMPRSAIEAMALGTPVLGADVYGIGELVEDGVSGWLVEALDLDALVAGLDRCLGTPPAELAAVARRAKERARHHHDAADYVAAYATLLDDLIATAEPYASAPLRSQAIQSSGRATSA